MTPAQVLMECRRRGVELSVNGDKLRVVAEKGALTDELREALRRHKPALMELLRGPTEEDAIEATRQLNARGWTLLDSSVLGERVALCRDTAMVRERMAAGTVAFTLAEITLAVEARIPAHHLAAVVKAKLLLHGTLTETREV